jgi:hypothetical protein
MLKTLLWVSFFAICVCWAIGAYNRMVRLRARANEAFAAWQTTSAVLPEAFESYSEADAIPHDEAQEKKHQWQVKSQLAKDGYTSATTRYNHAIKQFPASLLAALFAFKPLIHNDEKII